MMTTGQIVNFWGEGHGRRPSASPQSAKWLRPSTSSLWGQHSRHTAGTPGKCESLLDYTGTNLPEVAINRTLWALHANRICFPHPRHNLPRRGYRVDANV